MGLEKELEGVTAPQIESPDDLADDDTDDVVATPDDGDEPEGDKPKGRTIENVRGELLRKQTESTKEIMAQLNQLANTVAQLATNRPSTAPSGEKTLDDMSMEELRTLKTKISAATDIPAEKKAEFDEYYTDRKVAERVNQTLNSFQENEKHTSERKRANQLAVDRYPALLEKGSPMHAEVNRRLATLDQNYIKYNPRIVLNIADDVAAENGIAPRVLKGTRTGSAPSSVGRTARPATSTKQPNAMSEETYATLSEKLKHGIRGKKFDKDRIMKRSAEYADYLKEGN